MKTKMTIDEFKDYIEERPPRCIAFHTRRQSWFDVADPCKLELIFANIFVSINPAIVYLKSELGIMYLDRVRFVEVEEKKSSAEATAFVHCGGTPTTPEITYILILSY